MFRQGSMSRVAWNIFGFLILCLLSALLVPVQISAAPRAQAVDVCALMPPGAASTFKIPTAASAPQFQGGCQATYRTGKFIGTNQAEVMLMVNVQIWSPSDLARQRVMQCSMVTPGSGTCVAGVGEVGADFTDKLPGTYWWADSARGCFWFRTSSDYSADPAVIAQGRAIQKQIDDKLKTLPPCPGMPTPIPAQLNVGIGGNYDEANERVNVTADVTQRPNVGIGDDYYEWTLDGAPIQKGKELKSIEYDTTKLANGEHEIVVKVTDIPNNVTGGATYKFTKTKSAGGAQSPFSKPAQVQITTPAGTQPLNAGTKTPVTLPSGKAEIQARCDAVVYGLLTYTLYKEGEDPDAMSMKGKALALAIMVQAYCDKLLARSAAGDAPARPDLRVLMQNTGAAIDIDVQQGAGQFEITHASAAVRFNTPYARVQVLGKQSLVVAYDPDTQSTMVRTLNGTVTVSSPNASFNDLTLTSGQQVKVNANGIGAVTPFAQPAAQTGQQLVVNAVDNDPENKLWNCETNRIPFGNEETDRSRCFTFRYQVPAGGINSAVVNINLNTLGSLQDTDATVMAVGKPYQPCEWAYGGMPGCVVLHGGFEGKHRSLSLNLLDIACDKSVAGSPEAQQLVREQLSSGVVHMLLQDDTAVYGAQLVLNGAIPNATCGASEQPAQILPPTGGTSGGNSSAGNNSGSGSSVPGSTLNAPPYGSPEPYPNVNGRTLQVAQRRAAQGDLVLLPVWLIKADDVANVNAEITYDANVVRPEGNITKGNLLDKALFSANPNDSGIVRLGFAQTENLGNGTGTLVNIPFRVVGKPGDRTPLMPTVTKINNQAGDALSIDRLAGEIVIVGPNEGTQGDCDGDNAVTEADALCALEISVQLRAPVPGLDLNGDGAITSRDAVLILQRAIGK